jgi:hypothetical protein
MLSWLFCAAIAAAIAHAKNRNVGEGFLWGALLGVVGVIIVICLPPPKSKTLLPLGAGVDPKWLEAEQVTEQRRRAGPISGVTQKRCVVDVVEQRAVLRRCQREAAHRVRYPTADNLRLGRRTQSGPSSR